VKQRPVRWGIVGTGDIAGQFAAALVGTEGAELAAVGSRSAATAEAFAAAHGVEVAHDSYEGVFSDSRVDIVYVATPHALHRPNALAALAGGKAVLCEKPFAINGREAREMVAAARRAGLFLMEAMWTRFLPLVARLQEMLAGGAIGEPRLLSADFGFRADTDRRGIHFDPALGGGSLLDVGVYPVALSHLLWGSPERVEATATMGPTGVDEQCAMSLRWGNGAVASLSSSFLVDSPLGADISGTAGRVRIHRPWWRPDALTLTAPDGRETRVEAAFLGNGYVHEALEAQRCFRAGLLESPIMPLADSVATVDTLDAIRAAIGLRYPMD